MDLLTIFSIKLFPAFSNSGWQISTWTNVFFSFLFFFLSSPYIFYWIEIWTVCWSCHWPIQIHSSLNITVIQSSTCFSDCFSLARCNFVFFCLGVSAGFCLAFLYVNHISFSWFLIVLSQTLTPVFAHLFLFWRYIVLSFLSWHFDIFLGLPACFPFMTFPFRLCLHQILDAADWEQPTSLATLCVKIPCWRSYIILSIVSTDNSVDGAMFPFN